MRPSLIRYTLFSIGSIVSIVTINFSVYAQSFSTSYHKLKTYEGLYQYINNATLNIAASPKDVMLYAIVNQSRYPLRAISKDVFLNTSNDTVRFLRDKRYHIYGYTAGGDTFKVLNAKVSYPLSMWYPRLLKHPETYSYNYKVPQQLNDGIKTSDLKGTQLSDTLLRKMMNKIVKGDYPNVRSILIMKDGKLVFEEYFYDYTRDRLQEMRSASKSIVSALTGIAIHQKDVPGVHARLGELLPQYKFKNPSSLKEHITLQDLLDNQSGVWYDAAEPKAQGNEVAMGNSSDWIQYTFDLPMIDTPGMKGRYNSGNPVTIGRIIELGSGKTLHDYAAQHLFTPMGITTFKWDFNPHQSGSEDFCQVYLRPRDMIKFGQLYLQDGIWNATRVLPEDWVKESTSKHSVVQGVNYGYLWWLKYLDTDNKRYDSFAAQGNGGQKIYVFRKLNLVVVTTGGNYNSQSPADELIKKFILPSFDGKIDK